MKTASSKGIVLQPRLYIVGEFEKATAHVYILENRYVFDNAVEGFDVCFQSFFALKEPYPEESKLVWLLAQKMLYDITTSYDKNSSSVDTLVNEISK